VRPWYQTPVPPKNDFACFPLYARLKLSLSFFLSLSLSLPRLSDRVSLHSPGWPQTHYIAQDWPWTFYSLDSASAGITHTPHHARLLLSLFHLNPLQISPNLQKTNVSHSSLYLISLIRCLACSINLACICWVVEWYSKVKSEVRPDLPVSVLLPLSCCSSWEAIYPFSFFIVGLPLWAALPSH
jgi:hypothetical protein